MLSGQLPVEGLLAARASGGVGSGVADILRVSGVPNVISLAGGFPDPQTFPGAALADILKELIEVRDVSALQYAPIDGVPSMLDLLFERIGRLEGKRPSAGEVLVTSGGIDGLGLVSRCFLEQGDVVAVEAPTYLGALLGFQSSQSEVVALPMDYRDGLEPDAVVDLARRRRLKLLYTIPDFQNPAGVTMALERRQALVAAARQYGFLIIEDVAYRELGFRNEQLSSLWSIAPDVVVQLGTFSKTFCPGVRLGWALASSSVIEHLVLAKQLSDQCASALAQRLVELYTRRGFLDAQLTLSRQLYERRCRLLLDALSSSMPDTATWTRPTGGFFVWVTLPRDIDTTQLAHEAVAEASVAIVPGAPFFPDGGRRNDVRLSFSNVDDRLIAEAIHRLATVVRKRLQHDGRERLLRI